MNLEPRSELKNMYLLGGLQKSDNFKQRKRIKTRFEETQISSALKEYEAGNKRHRIYAEGYPLARTRSNMWRRKYGGEDRQVLRQYRERERENVR